MLTLRAMGNLGLNGSAARAVSQYFTDNYADYYVKGLDENHAGEWTGNGADRLNLEGPVNREILQMALGGCVNGSSVQNVGDPRRQMGWDLTFSAPKSVSIVWAFTDKNHREEIITAHRQAAEKAFLYIQNKVTTRRGKGGYIKEKAQIAVAHFTHFTSRHGDPQIHSHFVIPNFSVRKDGTVGAIESEVFYIYRMAAGYLYQAELAMNMRALGYQVEKGIKGTFRLKTVAQAVERNFSKRDIEIELMAEKLGIKNYAGKSWVSMITRPNKVYTTLIEREEIWNSEVEKLNLTTHFKRQEQQVKADRVNHRERFEAIRSQLTEHQSTFEEKDIVRQIAMSYMGEASIKEVAVIYDVFVGSKGVMLLGRNDFGNILYTTEKIMEIEKNILGFTNRLVKKPFLKINPDEAIHRRPELSPEQIQSITSACQGSSIVVIQGRAGTGKTTLLSALKESYEKKGIVVNGVAFTGQSAQQMQNESGVNSQTAHSWLNKPEYEKNSALIIDEAGMLGSRMIHDIFEKALHHDMKIIMVGDERQLQPIEPGGTLHMIDRHLLDIAPENSSQINTIKRQRHAWMREVVKNASLGLTREALKEMNEHRHLEIYDSSKQARERLIDEFLKKDIHHQKEAVILTHQNCDAFIINKEIRERLKEEKLIKEKGVIFDNGRNQMELAEGDRIIFTKNNYRIDVRNGQRGSIEKVHALLPSVDITLDNGQIKTINLNEYHHLNYGWALTTYKAQGITVERAYVYGFSQESMASRQSTYVQLSRAKEETRMFIVSGEGEIELQVKEKDRQIDYLGNEEALKNMQKFWGRDASKYTAVETEKELERVISKERYQESQMLLSR